jgi:hypothetical protein
MPITDIFLISFAATAAILGVVLDKFGHRIFRKRN